MQSVDISEVIKKIGARTIIAALCVIVFFVTIILTFYYFLYNSTRENMQLRGESIAIEAADKFDRYLTMSSNIVNLEREYFNQMLEDGATHEEMQNYIVEETERIQTSINKDYSGLYAYIQGEYHDGANWVPDDDWVATERPWYIEAVKKQGEMVCIQPYLDAQTQAIVTTLCAALSDGESVVALDISFDMIKTVTAGSSEMENQPLQIIIDDSGNVVAHSVIEEIGNRYDEDDGSLGYAISEKLKTSPERCVEVKHEGTRYMVYTIMLTNGWRSISVINATENYRPLNRMLLIVFAVLVVTIVILARLFINYSIKSIKEKEMTDLSERAVAASEAKSAFLSNMSHEIRTPINAMLGLNEMILRESSDKDTLSYASGIDTAGHTLLGIVNDILDFSKIEAGKMEIIPVDYSLSSTLNDLSNMVYTRAEKKGLSITLKVDKHIPEKLHGDEIRVKQVITNILTNAVKYTEKGGITFKVDYDIVPTSSNEIDLKVSVKDTGIGIKEKDMAKLFSEFDRIEEKRNRNIEGTGLGMAITQSLLFMMGSELKVESVYGKGSTFSFTIRQKVVEWKEIGDYEKTYKETREKKPGYKERFVAPEADVLVVDDTPLNLTVFKSLLKKTQVRIETAESGETAIRKACRKTYDIVFLDHMMPEMDGIETLAKLKKDKDNKNKKTPFVCLTANAISGAREKYIEAGFDDYLTKPIDSARLEEMLMQYLPPEKVHEPEEDEVPEEEVQLPEFIYKIEELDVDTAVKNCGSTNVYEEILHAFEDNIDECVRETEDYYKTGVTAELAVKVHAIKSELRTIGAFKLGDFAQTLEDAAKKDDKKTLEQHMNELFASCRKLSEKMSVLKTGGFSNSEELPPLTEAEVDSLFDRIRSHAINYDFEQIEELTETLRTHNIPVRKVEKAKELCRLVDNFDYDRIPELLG